MAHTEIRPAVLADVPWLLAECRAFDRFANAAQGYSFIPDDAAVATAVLTQIVATCVCYVAVRLADDGDEMTETPQGFIVGALHAHPFNPGVTVLTELLWWVRPECRATLTGGRLLGVFEAYGHQHADLVVMTLEADSPVAPASLQRRGYAPRETSYVLVTNRTGAAV